MNRFTAIAASLQLAFIGAASASPNETAAERLRADVAFLADDALMGREAGSEGYDAAVAHVVSRMKEIGLKPASRRDWIQEVPLRSAKRDASAAKLSIVSGGTTTELAHLEDFMIGASYNAPSFSQTAPLAYVGYGVSAPEEGVDDYAGVDVKGRIVVAFTGAPASFSSEKRAYYSSFDVKMDAAAARGAAGFLVIPTKDAVARWPWERSVSTFGRAGMETVGPDGRAEKPAITPIAFLSEAGAAKVFAGEAMEFAALQAREAETKAAPKSFEMAKTATIAGASVLTDLSSANVIGIIEGSDPKLKKEVVLLTAHLDHIGVSPNAKPGEDSINNGALDNASGVAALLETARSFAKSGVRPKRTIAFAALTGEEKGLLGSDYLARHPAFGGRRLVSVVNLDMPVVLYSFTDVIAFGAERSSLGEIVASAAGSMDIATSPDPFPDENIFIRSDHFSFVKQGTPAVFLVPGFANGGEKAIGEFRKNHYHRPSDDLSLPIDYEALARFAELNFRVARDLADAPAAPSWVAGDFFGDLFAK